MAVSRRDFLIGAGVGGALAGVPLAWLLARAESRRELASAPNSIPAASREPGLPGRYPAQVIEVQGKGAVRPDWSISRDVVRRMLDRGMLALTGADHPSEAWGSLFTSDDVVAIKVNPVGNNGGRPGVVSVISSPALVLEVVRNLRAVGIPAANIILFERYASEFIAAGYETLTRERDMDGVRWFASSDGYSPTQVAIDGMDYPDNVPPEVRRHVAGYDPDAFVTMGFSAPEHDPKDDRRFRSHLSTVVTRMVSKVITLPNLKDHRSSGVTLSLKNMSHGFNNNVARSHISGIAHGKPDSPGFDISGPNQCNTFIPLAVNQAAIREKATLHILDGLIGVYEGGPGSWNKTWGVWPANKLLLATDPVSLDHIGWDIIDAKRVEMGLRRSGQMGKHLFDVADRVRMALTPLAANTTESSMSLTAAERFIRGGGESEVFDRRQPEHIFLAGTIGLGEFARAKIRHRLIAG